MTRTRGHGDMRPAKVNAWARASRGNINALDRVDCEVNCVNEVAGKKGNWERSIVPVDSGAIHSVGPAAMTRGIQIK